MWRIVCLALVGWPYAQAQPSYPTISKEDLATFSLYQQLFEETANFQLIADQLKAKGQDDRGARHQLALVSGLIPSQEDKVISVAKPCMEAVNSNRRRISELLLAIRARRKPGTPYSSAEEEQVVSLQNQNIARVFSAIHQLQAALGDAGFQKLDHYVRRVIAEEFKQPGMSLYPPAGAVRR